MFFRNEQIRQFSLFLLAVGLGTSLAYHAINRNLILLNTARRHSAHGRYEQAAMVYEKLRDRGFQPDTVLEQLVDCYFSLGRPQEARTALQSLISTEQKPDPFRLRQLAATALWLGMHEVAADEYRNALSLRQGDRSARLGLARALAFSGRFEEAVCEYRILLGE